MTNDIVNWLIDHWVHLLAGAIIISLVGIMACGVYLIMDAVAPKLTGGVVIDKDYDAPYTSTHTNIVDGKPVVSTSHYGASYSIKVQGVNDEGETVAEWWSLGEGLYSLISIGDRVTREGNAIRRIGK